ncbi:transposase [Streptomyces sp. NPDC101733]|uniref:transposase n=1 Tax=unclassified Streptomyces TaxID=2593676 RepID=UPI0037F412A1
MVDVCRWLTRSARGGHPLLPERRPRRGRRWRDHQQVIDTIAFKYGTGVPWMDLPEHFGSWKGATTGCVHRPPTGPERRSSSLAIPGLMSRATSTGSSPATPPSSEPTSTPPGSVKSGTEGRRGWSGCGPDRDEVCCTAPVRGGMPMSTSAWDPAFGACSIRSARRPRSGRLYEARLPSLMETVDRASQEVEELGEVVRDPVELDSLGRTSRAPHGTVRADRVLDPVAGRSTEG